MTEVNEGKAVTRRGFLTVAVATGAALVGKGAVDWLADRQGDLANPEILAKFLPGPELFPGYYSYFNGKVFLKEGASIYSEPRALRASEEPGVVTPTFRRETLMQTLTSAETFSVVKPFIYLRQAASGLEGSRVIDILGPDGSSKRADLAQSWVIFGPQESLPQELRGDILRSQWGVGCVNMADWSLRWQKSGQEQIVFDPQGLFFTKTIELK